ncbi:hypothetical protein HanXRQr2_Chr08g0341471 [Helianthus annuus]|uniref:Uncharacterized protein n=1 Tax=Helianthus annuus TaxID=4232 RepID=A0A9K3NCP8_HELAN|nr:hypothetical protein HanXRQr2_Chr08g0341471 [Helianthus annuus]
MPACKKKSGHLQLSGHTQKTTEQGSSILGFRHIIVYKMDRISCHRSSSYTRCEQTTTISAILWRNSS